MDHFNLWVGQALAANLERLFEDDKEDTPMRKRTVDQVCSELEDLATRVETHDMRATLRQAAAMLRVLFRRLGVVLARRELWDAMAEAQELVEQDGEPPLCVDCGKAYLFRMDPGITYCPGCGATRPPVP